MEAIILLGGPGAGKGTLAEDLKEKTPYIHVSTGNLLREAVKSGSELGKKVAPLLKSGQLVSDELVLGIIRERLKQEPSDAMFMFDGFPRTIDQAKGLQNILSELNGTITHVLNLEVPTDVLISRLCGRRICRTCGAIFNVVTMPPKEEGICDLDGGDLFQRTDDNKETVMNRLKVYQEFTEPLIEFYKKSGLIHSVNAAGSPVDAERSALDELAG